MKRAFVVLFLLCLIASTAQAAQIVTVTPFASEILQYEMFEIAVTLADEYDNPYDPDRIDLYAVFVSPSRAEQTAVGYWFEPYTRSLEGDLEVFTPAGAGEWRVRFAPLEQGEYEFHIVAVDVDGTDVSDDIFFTAVAPTSSGFVRVDPANSRYFVFDNGDSYVPLGYNLDWVREAGGGFAYIDYLDAMIDGGGNWTRMWLTHFGQGLTLEWGAYHSTGYYEGLGRYSQQIGCKLDAIFAHAQENGAFIQMVLHQHSQFESSQWSSWGENPYNQVNGGPCATSADYFTDAEALRLERNLHRYLVARYAAFRSLLAWEIFNEADGIMGVNMQLMTPWAQDVAADLRAQDPAEHMVSTSFATPFTLPTFDLETWDFNNRHQYVLGSWMVGMFLPGYFAAEKPLLLSEFGIDWWAGLNDRDPLGVNIHNGIWNALLAGYAGGAMNWWWDDYVGPQDLWALNEAPAAFLAGEQMSRFTGDAQVEAKQDRARLEATGIGAFDEKGLTEAWLWIHDAKSTWMTPAEQIAPLDGVQVAVSGCGESPRSWTGEVWDTWTGETIDEVAAQSDGDSFTFTLPEFSRDVAIKMQSELLADDDTVDDDTADDDTNDDDIVDDDDDQADDDVVDDDSIDTDDDLAPDGQDDDDDSEDEGCGC